MKTQLSFIFEEVFVPKTQDEIIPDVPQAKRGRPTKFDYEIICERNGDKAIIHADGFQTTIEIYQKCVYGEQKFVTKVVRDYPDGNVYEEPEHVWPTYERARLDAKDWEALAELKDW